MKIKEILQCDDPKTLKTLEKIKSKKNNYIAHKKIDEKLSDEDIKELMYERCYKRGPTGALRQVR